jgi:hypothetical protein
VRPNGFDPLDSLEGLGLVGIRKRKVTLLGDLVVNVADTDQSPLMRIFQFRRSGLFLLEVSEILRMTIKSGFNATVLSITRVLAFDAVLRSDDPSLATREQNLEEGSPRTRTTCLQCGANFEYDTPARRRGQSSLRRRVETRSEQIASHTGENGLVPLNGPRQATSGRGRGVGLQGP